MNCGIALFIYDRPQCTEKVLEALKRNHIENLYVFQDGLGENTNREAWEQNGELIQNIDWCNVTYEKSERKASSLDVQVIHGINRVFQEKDEIIVIEDDCIISDDCIEYFYNCFERYKTNNKVINVDAYLPPITIPDTYNLPIIATGVTSSWGWGTWKDRWEEFQKDFDIIKKIGRSMKKYEGFSDFGYSIKKTLTDYWLLGTWDLWWSINILVKEGISIRPTYNKVYNIGFENPGTHTSGKSIWVNPIAYKTGSREPFPEELQIEPWTKMEFKKFFQKIRGRIVPEERQTYYRRCLEKWLGIKQQGKNIGELLSKKKVDKIVIFGIGPIGELLVNELMGQDKIEYFIVTNKAPEQFMGYPIYECGVKLPEKSDELSLIVIPGYDMDEIKRMVGHRFKTIYSLEDIFNLVDVVC